jgi:hypothetical protein
MRGPSIVRIGNSANRAVNSKFANAIESVAKVITDTLSRVKNATPLRLPFNAITLIQQMDGTIDPQVN